MKHSTTTLIDFAFWSGLALLTALCIALSTGLTGCSGPPEFQRASVAVGTQPTTVELTSDLQWQGAQARLEVAVLLSDELAEVDCVVLSLAGVQWTPQPMLANSRCLQWLASRPLGAKSSAGVNGWPIVERVVGVAGEFLRGLLGWGWPAPDT